MSNLELAQQFVDLAVQRDWRQLELMAEDVVYRPIEEVTETGEYVGRDAYRGYMEAFLEGEWASDLTFGARSLREYGDAVIVRFEMTGHGRASGIDLDIRIFQVLHFSDGVIVRVEDFVDRAKALAAAGAQG